jgi:hypothetical protein
MNLTKKFIFISTALIIILSSLILSSFAIEEKDHINQALKFIDEEKYNEAVVELEEVLMLVKSKSSLEFVSVVFANEEAGGFGLYNQRENATFAPGETIFIYGEAKNYTIKESQNNLYEIYLKEDLYILDQDNNVLFGQADFLDYHITSHSKNSDLFINNTITQTSPFPVGNYKFRLVLKDIFSQKTTEVIIEFTVTE